MSQKSKMVTATLDWLQMLRTLPKEHADIKRKAIIWDAIMKLDKGLDELPVYDQLEIRTALREYFHHYMTPKEEHEIDSYYASHLSF